MEVTEQDLADALGLDDEEPPEPQPADAETKWCDMCDENLPLSEFKMTMRTNKHGEPFAYYSAMCITDANTIESLQKAKIVNGGMTTG